MTPSSELVHRPANALRGRTVERRPVDDREWTAFAGAHPAATPFHHPAWAGLLSETYRYPAFALVVLNGHGTLLGGLPVLEVRKLRGKPRWVSLPFTDHLAPLCSPGLDPGALRALLDQARETAGIPSLALHTALAEPRSSDFDQVIHTLALDSDPGKVRAGFAATRRRNIRQAERSGVQVVHGSSRPDLATVYYDLHVRTRRRQGVPPQPRRFFELLWDRMLAPGLGFVLLAYADGAPIAGAVFLCSGSTVVYKYGASLPEFWPLRANALLQARAIEWSCEHGYRQFDFGRSERANMGLRSFKSNFGAAERPLVYTSLGASPQLGPRRTATMSWAASSALRRAPLAVCRGTGALLYRYAA